MDSSLIALMMLSLFLGCGCWLLFLWAVRDGQFSDIERAKYRMLDDDESIAPPPGGGRLGGGRNVAHEETVRPLPDPPPPSLPAEALAEAEPARRSLGEGGRGSDGGRGFKQ